MLDNHFKVWVTLRKYIFYLQSWNHHCSTIICHCLYQSPLAPPQNLINMQCFIHGWLAISDLPRILNISMHLLPIRCPIKFLLNILWNIADGCVLLERQTSFLALKWGFFSGPSFCSLTQISFANLGVMQKQRRNFSQARKLGWIEPRLIDYR